MKKLGIILLSTIIISCSIDLNNNFVDASKIMTVNFDQITTDTAKIKVFVINVILNSEYVNKEQEVHFKTEYGSLFSSPIDSLNNQKSITVLTAGLKASSIFKFTKCNVDSISISASITSKEGSIYQVFKRVKAY